MIERLVILDARDLFGDLIRLGSSSLGNDGLRLPIASIPPLFKDAVR